MAATHIPIDTSKPRGNRLYRLAGMTREVMGLFDECKAVMEAATDVADYSLVETLYGLPAGKGQDAYNLVVAARAKVKDAATSTFVDRLG